MIRRSSSRTTSPPALRVRVLRADEDGAREQETVLVEATVIGRDDDADLRIESGLVSRRHAELAPDGGRWRVRDLGSANGTFIDGERVLERTLAFPASIELGLGGPVLQVDLDDGGGRPVVASAAEPSVTQVLDYYFSESSGPAGEKTQLVRQAYRRVHRSHRKRVFSILGLATVLLGAALGAALWQRERAQEERARVEEMTALADTLFAQMRERDVSIARLRDSFGISSDSELDSLVAQAEALRAAGADPALAGGPSWTIDPIQLAAYIREEQRRRQAIESNYNRFVSELGVYRNATAQEAAILRMARIFNESEVSVDAAFVEEVQRYIAEWRRRGLGRVIQQAEEAGYDRLIAETMRDHGLPVEFFYLALAESYFNPRAVGTPTRYGYAKGMWQFIPSTARDFGLTPGPLVDEQIYDPLDERHDVAQSTRAAALYIRKLYTDLAQASGLLAMACYNWGEGNVLPKLSRLPNQASGAPPDDAPGTDALADDDASRSDSTSTETTADPAELAATIEAQFAGIPQDPQQRSYWRFLNTYRNRMPEETRNYVMRIFSAAVIGSNPQLFGFDFENPLDT